MAEDLFSFVVSFFANWGWQTLGKIENPATGKTEKNLEMTERVIDILQMLKKKTAGNLETEEERLLNSVLAELQMNYVEEQEKGEEKPEDEGKTGESSGPATEEETGETKETGTESSGKETPKDS